MPRWTLLRIGLNVGTASGARYSITYDRAATAANAHGSGHRAVAISKGYDRISATATPRLSQERSSNGSSSDSDVDDLAREVGDEHGERGLRDRERGEQAARRLLAERAQAHRRAGPLG